MRIRDLTSTGLAGLGTLVIAACGGGSDEPAPPIEPTTTEQSGGDGGGGDDGGDAQPPSAGDGEGGVELTEIGSFEAPVYLTQPPSGDDDALYVVEQCGTIQRVPIDGGKPTTFLDIGDLVTCGGEQGLLSVAFAPDYEQSGSFYVNYTNLDERSITAEYRRSDDDPATADPEPVETVAEIDDFAPNHNGGLLMFDADENLLLGMGDGGDAGDPERTAQDPDNPLGGILRVEAGAEPEKVILGLRNPWRYSFDRETGDLWIGDVGQDAIEEIDALAASKLRAAEDGDEVPNFGWSAFEGTEPFNSDQRAPGAIQPVFQYGRDRGCSVTGGYVVRDRELESLYGRYLYGDFCEGELRSFTADPSRPATDDVALGLDVSQLSSFGEDLDANVYAVSLDGPVYRLDPEGS